MRSFRSRYSSKSSGGPLVFPIGGVKSLHFLTQVHRVISFMFGNFSLIFLWAAANPYVGAYFAISCLSFSL